ncbi:MAG: glycerophosphodiester phosphodiesterase, partial [Mesorhizobium sp.]
FWVDRGATIIQTDEPKAAIEWLAANGYRVPYMDEARPAEPARTASIN